ncbi:hypothetical protein LV164_007940 [Aspergillus fumigatus]|nr:hypothetical protein KXX42_004043 [Aspergillus fumigatus]KAH2309709.1 hypothetical protein KXV47_005702 [Aspergillus fumigatus]KAH2748648.1 hypothetical protein KXV94_004224 [Aspergillus fumigatus]KAH2909175.1 hypothetical protein KXW25_004283 [Aspergillus fumigatus]KAH3005880.1 hypothetical protein KXW60_004404 [Aspergillus fumigatus]
MSQRPTSSHDSSAPHHIPVDDCLTYDTGYRPNLPGQRTWWVFCPVTGAFDNSYALLGAMIECVARGQATLAPAWDRTFAGGIWAVDDMQRRIERYMSTNDGRMGCKPALGFRFVCGEGEGLRER